MGTASRAHLAHGLEGVVEILARQCRHVGKNLAGAVRISARDALEGNGPVGVVGGHGRSQVKISRAFKVFRGIDAEGAHRRCRLDGHAVLSAPLF